MLDWGSVPGELAGMVQRVPGLGYRLSGCSGDCAFAGRCRSSFLTSPDWPAKLCACSFPPQPTDSAPNIVVHLQEGMFRDPPADLQLGTRLPEVCGVGRNWAACVELWAGGIGGVSICAPSMVCSCSWAPACPRCVGWRSGNWHPPAAQTTAHKRRSNQHRRHCTYLMSHCANPI